MHSFEWSVDSESSVCVCDLMLYTYNKEEENITYLLFLCQKIEMKNKTTSVRVFEF